MPDIVALMQVMNQQPTDALDVEGTACTPELVRQIEAYQLAGNGRRWTLYAHEAAGRAIAGFTEVLLNSQQAAIVHQGNTGGLPHFRNHGLGRRLKATMLQRLIESWPSGRYVRTGNADSNAPMRKINRELGFTPYMSETLWQLELDGALARLAP